MTHDELRKLAERALLPKKSCPACEEIIARFGRAWGGCGACAGEYGERKSAFQGAANPTQVIALLDRIEALERERDAMTDKWRGEFAMVQSVTVERDALRAALEDADKMHAEHVQAIEAARMREVVELRVRCERYEAALESYAELALYVDEGRATVMRHGVRTVPIYEGETWHPGERAREALQAARAAKGG